MTDGTTSDLSQYRIERANSTLEEAALLAEKGFWAAATNRLYYACFYAASALLLKQGKNFRRHSGLIAVFNTDFVRTGIVPVETGAVLSMLFSHRQRADYDDLPQFDKEQVDNWRRQAHDFVSPSSAKSVVVWSELKKGGQGAQNPIECICAYEACGENCN